MNDVRTRGSVSRSRVKYLRLPLLLLTGVLSMGSGMGNPGCGGGDSEPACVDDCFIEGTWDISYAYPSQLPRECLEAGVVLPTGPLEITRTHANITATVGDLVIDGVYSGGGFDNLSLSGLQDAGSAPHRHRFRYSGTLSPLPSSKDKPLSWVGTFNISPFDSEGPCVAELGFTATR